MNQKLKFSWAHIVAFLAMIFMGYVVFMGITYYTLGNVLLGGIGALLVVLLFAVTIIGAQYLKGTHSARVYKAIKKERVLLLLSIPVLLLAFVPYNHFWTVQSHEKQIVDNFSTAVQASKEMFPAYEKYATERVQRLQRTLHDRTDMDEALVQNRTEELEAVLLNDGYKNLSQDANAWIEKSCTNPSVWNVFLFGNLSTIKKTIMGWNNSLNEISAKELMSEHHHYIVEPFGQNNQSCENALAGLSSLEKVYTTGGFSLIGLLTLLLCYGALLLPYFVQERHARNTEMFWDFWIFSRTHHAKPASSGVWHKGEEVPVSNVAPGPQTVKIVKPAEVKNKTPKVTAANSDKGKPI